jgi:alpha-beta hydrolase superfamily lysophospholipase
VSEFEPCRIRLPDGYEAYARYWRPAGGTRGAVLYLHGIQSHCGWYEASARRLREAGLAVLQPDRRGSGQNSQERGHAESAEQLINDTLACLDELLRRSGLRRAHLIGISWGGKLVAAVHVTEPARIASLVLVTPGLFPLVGVSNTEKFRIGLAMVSNRTASFDIPLNDPALFTSIPERTRFLEVDPLQLHQATAGFYLASRRMDKTAQALGEAPAIPLHLMLAGDERIIDNERTRQFVRDLRWPSRALTTYQHSRHTLEFDPDREPYLEDLVSWFIDPSAYCAGPRAETARHP